MDKRPEDAHSKLIQVVGDPTVDWMIIRRDMSSGEAFWLDVIKRTRSNICAQPGGAALLTCLLSKLYPGQVAGIELADVLLQQPNTGRVVCTYTVWKEADKQPDGFRITEWLDSDRGRFDYQAYSHSHIPQTLVIDDASLGFRDTPESWPAALKTDADHSRLQHIIFKSSMFHQPKSVEPLYSRIAGTNLAQKSTLLIPVSDLRKCPVSVGPSLSWERMSEQVVNAVLCSRCPFTKDNTLGFARVIVTIGLSGAVLIEPQQVTVIFDREGQEGYWQKRHAGFMLGYNTCVAAALVKAAHDNPEAPQWQAAIKLGLQAARTLHLSGYKFSSSNLLAIHPTDQQLNGTQGESAKYLAFPMEAIVDLLCHMSDGNLTERINKDFAAVCADLNASARCDTLLEFELAKDAARIDPTYAIAARIVKFGPEAVLPAVPVEKIGHWQSADRYEIEGMCSIRNLIVDYVGGDRSKPLSIAVFGPPGAGKSYAIKQVARDLDPELFTQIPCNLSQYTDIADLVQAFHHIRDVNLRGQIPLVFWDEFDGQLNNQPYGWLRYFLAPMQDGLFLDQGMEHPLGAGIYIFAGGTSSTFESFARGMSGARAKKAKLPDFVSRLKGYINIKGINPFPDSIRDQMHVIRRAFALRVILKKAAEAIFNHESCRIDEDVLRALLKQSTYKHGIRSLESIVAISDLRGKSSFGLSCLPPASQLALHVDAAEFTALLKSRSRGTLKIGVTGHRFLAEEALLRAGAQEAIQLIAEKYPEYDLRVLTSLAQGADILLTEEILVWQSTQQAAQHMIAILPFGVADCETTFSGATADETSGLIQQFRHYLGKATEVIEMPGCASSEAAYRQCGQFIADNCDVLLAIWDGEKPQGPGGTAEVVQRAADNKLPVIVIRAGNRQPGTSLPILHPDQGQVTCINLN